MFKALLNSVVAMINSERELKLTLFLEKNINNGQLSNNANNKNFVRLMILLHNCEQSTGGMRIINFLTEAKQNDPKQTYITNGHILIGSPSIRRQNSTWNVCVNYIDFERQIYLEIMTSIQCGNFDVDSTFRIDKISMSAPSEFLYVASMSNRRRIDVTSVLAVSILSFSNIFCSENLL